MKPIDFHCNYYVRRRRIVFENRSRREFESVFVTKSRRIDDWTTSLRLDNEERFVVRIWTVVTVFFSMLSVLKHNRLWNDWPSFLPSFLIFHSFCFFFFFFIFYFYFSMSLNDRRKDGTSRTWIFGWRQRTKWRKQWPPFLSRLWTQLTKRRDEKEGKVKWIQRRAYSRFVSVGPAEDCSTHYAFTRSYINAKLLLSSSY